MIGQLSYFSNNNEATIQRRLENRSEQLIEQNWLAIKALAIDLLSEDPEPVKPLKSGCTWSNESTAKYLTGEEVVSKLGRYSIAAVCDPEC